MDENNKENNKESGLGTGVKGFNSGDFDPSRSTGNIPSSSSPYLPQREKVEVNKDSFERLIKKVDEQALEIQKLTEIADKGRLAHWETTHKSSIAKIYYLSTYRDKIIVSWEMKVNTVMKNPKTNVWEERQEIEIVLENGEREVLAYVEFVSNTHKLKSRLVSTEQKGGKTYLTVEIEGGKKFTIDSVFVN